MKFTIEAACGCHIGKVRRNNEDNFFFNGKCLEAAYSGLKYPVSFEDTPKSGLCFAVFDGMGGENFGEVASYAAARRMQQEERTLADFLIPVKQYLNRLSIELNQAVLKEKEDLCTDRMGSTMVALYFSGRYTYTCNLGDSRAYRLRDSEFLQISQDHVEKRPHTNHKKAPLTQYLGIDPEEMQIEPYIAKGKIHKGDRYLLCSDGLTDMLTDFEISDIMLKSQNAESCVQNLVQAALEHGGRDNITVIVCRVM